MKSNIKPIPWTITDTSTSQFGRKISDKVFEFKETRKRKVFQMTIDLTTYDREYIEDVITSYGYTLDETDDNYIGKIYEVEGEADWIIAECLFEMES